MWNLLDVNFHENFLKTLKKFCIKKSKSLNFSKLKFVVLNISILKAPSKLDMIFNEIIKIRISSIEF